MQAYRIANWQKNYEVTKDGKAASSNCSRKNLRQSPLAFVRLPVQGHNPSLTYRLLLAKAGKNGMAVFGIFCKLLELAANQSSQYRGWILDDKQQPMNASQIAFCLCCQTSDTDYALQILCEPEIALIEKTDWLTHSSCQPTEQTVKPDDCADKTDDEKKNESPYINETNNENEDKDNINEKENNISENETKANQSNSAESRFTTDADEQLKRLSEKLRNKFPHNSKTVGNIRSNIDDILLSAKDNSSRNFSSNNSSSVSPSVSTFDNSSSVSSVGSAEINTAAKSADLKPAKPLSPLERAIAAPWSWDKLKVQWTSAMHSCFRRSRFNSSDTTTLFEMAKHLYINYSPIHDAFFKRVVELARRANEDTDIKNPMAWFVEAFKKTFGDFTEDKPKASAANNAPQAANDG
jgi:hypothetical protein